MVVLFLLLALQFWKFVESALASIHPSIPSCRFFYAFCVFVPLRGNRMIIFLKMRGKYFNSIGNPLGPGGCNAEYQTTFSSILDRDWGDPYGWLLKYVDPTLENYLLQHIILCFLKYLLHNWRHPSPCGSQCRVDPLLSDMS